jgi:hypothetical protein
MLSRVIPTVRDLFLARNFNTLVEQSEQRHQSTPTLFIRSAGARENEEFRDLIARAREDRAYVW